MTSARVVVAVALLVNALVPASGLSLPDLALDFGPFSGTPADVHRHAAAWGLGKPLVASAPAASMDLGSAAALLMERHGGIQPEVLAQLAAVPSSLEPALARVFVAFLAFEQEAGADQRDVHKLFGHRQALLQAILDLGRELPDVPSLPIVIDASPAFTLDLSRADSAYAMDVALQIDAGGNDVYTNRAGGSLGDLGVLQFCDPLPLVPVIMPAAAVADFGGNDRYVSGKRCGVNGGGMAGAGFLYDAAGDDVYASGQGGVNGGAFQGGFGFLYDAGGNDRYVADVNHDTYAYGANGSGSLGGIGTLVDVSGDDEYVAGQEGANGGGYGLGIGLLLDGSGNDRYTATAFGVNGAGYSGWGLLWDGEGDDSYLAVGCCRHEPEPSLVEEDNGGGAGVSASGCLYDGDGHDRYEQTGRIAWDETVDPKGMGAQIDDVGRSRGDC